MFSPEACAAILWKSAKASPKVYIHTHSMLIMRLDYQYHNSSFSVLQAAEKLRITASELCRLQIADGIIPVIILLPLNKFYAFASFLGCWSYSQLSLSNPFYFIPYKKHLAGFFWARLVC